MAIADDISVATNGDIRWAGTTGTYTVLQLHRFLQDLADDASSSGDDLLDITSPNPSARSTDNIITLNSPYNIDDTLAQHLFDGSISQSGGDVLYSGLEVVGSLASETNIQIVQNNTLLTSYWGTGLNADPTANILLRILVKSRTGGEDIDGKRIRCQARKFGDTYSEFGVTLGQGISVAALNTSSDLNNQTASGTVGAWTITSTEGYQSLDLNNGNGARPYYSQWDKGVQSLNDLYEYAKYIQRYGSSETIHGIDGELFRGITHEWDYDNESSGPFVEDEILSWGTGATAGTALLLALDDNGSDGTMWVQLLTGVVPTDNATITGSTSSATCLVAGSVTQRTVSPCFIGQSTGTNIIGAFGIGLDPNDVGASDTLFDLTNTQQTPPNNQTFTVAGLVSGEDRVLVGPNNGSDALEVDQLSAAAGNSAGNGTLVVAETIPSDTPASGTVRAFNGSTYDRIPYSSYSGSTFTLTGTLPNTLSTGANVFISYIDKVAGDVAESYSATYASDRSLVVFVRDGGVTPIVPFKSPATFSSAGGSVTAIRTEDA